MSPRSAASVADEPSDPRTSTRVGPRVTTYSGRTPMSRPGARPKRSRAGLKSRAWMALPIVLLLLCGTDALWVVTAPAPSAALLATVESQATAPCAGFQVVGLRGHNDRLDTDQGLGADDWALAQLLKSQLASRVETYGVYALPYTQGGDLHGLPISVTRDISPGAELLAAYLTRRAAACPAEARVVIGQSEGAAIVHWAYPRIVRWLSAAILLGDALHLAPASYDDPAAIGGRGQLTAWMGQGFSIGSIRTPDTIPSDDATVLRSYCLPHDQVCDWNPFDPHADTHLDYRLNAPLWPAGPGVLDLAARFITSRVGGY